MKRVILLLGLTVFAIAIIQNSQPIPLVFFGFQIPWELPLSLSIVLFIAAGALTSLLLQLLNFTSMQTTAKATSNRSQQPYSPPPPDQESTPRSPKQQEIKFEKELQEQEREFPKRKTAAEPFYNNPPEADKSRWQSSSTIPEDDFPQEEKEWDIVEPPNETTRVEKFDPSLDRYKSTVFETRQEPKNVSRSGSIYSYTYKQAQSRPKPDQSARENTQTESSNSPTYPKSNNVESDQPSPTYSEGYTYDRPQKSDRVYDAKYRVITPPYRDLPHEPLDDEEDRDWID